MSAAAATLDADPTDAPTFDVLTIGRVGVDL